MYTRLLRNTFRYDTLAGRVLRLPLRLVSHGAVVPILSGPARGAKWIVGSATHGCWLGTYEAETQHLMTRLVTAGSVFWDVGANVGFYSVLAAKLAGPAGRVVAFEPLPENFSHLSRHIALNGLSGSVQAVQAAVASARGTARFSVGTSNLQGQLSTDGELTVEVVALDDLLRSDARPPDVIKIDVEGAEDEVLRGARALLGEARPVVVVALHRDAQGNRQSVEPLLAEGYRLESVPAGSPWTDGDTVVAYPPAR